MGTPKTSTMSNSSTNVDKTQTSGLVKNFINAFQTSCNQSTAANASTFETFLTNNFHLTSNNQKVANNLTDFLNRINNVQKKFSHIEVSTPTINPIASSNQFVAQYTINTTSRNGQKSNVSVMAIGTLDNNNKITSWNQVTHESGTSGTWETT